MQSAAVRAQDELKTAAKSDKMNNPNAIICNMFYEIILCSKCNWFKTLVTNWYLTFHTSSETLSHPLRLDGLFQFQPVCLEDESLWIHTLAHFLINDPAFCFSTFRCD